MAEERKFANETSFEVHRWALVAGIACETAAVLFRWNQVATLAGVLLMVSGLAAAVAGDSLFSGLTERASARPRLAAASASVVFLLGAFLCASGVSGAVGAPLPRPAEPSEGLPFPLPP
jgi:hypothetical protein